MKRYVLVPRRLANIGLQLDMCYAVMLYSD
jgi:hypothetical protein